jgi:ssDNA-binding Zn-finger/Zn-ribbon topoisomerase 1
MNKPVADDYEYIRKRMEEIADETRSKSKKRLIPSCLYCGGMGWLYNRNQGTFIVCYECDNPTGIELGNIIHRQMIRRI